MVVARKFLAFFFVFVCCENLAIDLFGDVVSSGLSIPQALAKTARAEQGEVVEIELESVSSEPGKRIEYLLREPPSKGTLVWKNANTVVYTPLTGEVLRDSFKFAVRHPRSPVSASARVDIVFKKSLADLRLPTSWDFGKIYAATASEIFMPLENLYHEELLVDFKVERPFFFKDSQGKFVGQKSLRLPKKKEIKLQIWAKPNKLGAISKPLRISFRHKTRELMLKAEALAPLSLEKSDLLLTYDSEKSAYVGELRAANMAIASLRADLNVSAELARLANFDFPRILLVGETSYLRGRVKLEDVTSLRELIGEGAANLELLAGEFAQEVTLKLADAPLLPIVFIKDSQVKNGEELALQETLALTLFNPNEFPIAVNLMPSKNLQVASGADFTGADTELVLPFSLKISPKNRRSIFLRTKQFTAFDNEVTLELQVAEQVRILQFKIPPKKGEQKSLAIETQDEVKVPKEKVEALVSEKEEEVKSPKSKNKSAKNKTDLSKISKRDLLVGLTLTSRNWSKRVPKPREIRHGFDREARLIVHISNPVEFPNLPIDFLKNPDGTPEVDKLLSYELEFRQACVDKLGRRGNCWVTPESIGLKVEKEISAKKYSVLLISGTRRMTPYWYRVIAIDKEGRAALPTNAVQIVIPPKPFARWIVYLALAFVIIIVSALIFWRFGEKIRAKFFRKRLLQEKFYRQPRQKKKIKRLFPKPKPIRIKGVIQYEDNLPKTAPKKKSLQKTQKIDLPAKNGDHE